MFYQLESKIRTSEGLNLEKTGYFILFFLLYYSQILMKTVGFGSKKGKRK